MMQWPSGALPLRVAVRSRIVMFRQTGMVAVLYER